MNQTLTQTHQVECRWITEACITGLDKCSYNEHLAVFCIRIRDFKDEIDGLRAYLNGNELLKSVNFVMEKDSHRFIVSRALLKIILGRYLRKQAHDIEFLYGENLKPVVKHNLPGVHFNVTHSGDLILIAVSSKPVGVDTEFLDEDFAYRQVMDISFSTREMNHISNSHNPSEAFFLLWTRKEAFLKGTGKGIDDALPSIPSVNGCHELQCELSLSSEPWVVGSFGIGHDYVASLAFHPSVTTPRLNIYAVGKEILSI